MKKPFETQLSLERYFSKILHLDFHHSERIGIFCFGESKHSERTQGGAAALEVEGRKPPVRPSRTRCSYREASRKGRLSKAVAPGNLGPRRLHLFQDLGDTGKQSQRQREPELGQVCWETRRQWRPEKERNAFRNKGKS